MQKATSPFFSDLLHHNINASFFRSVAGANLSLQSFWFQTFDAVVFQRQSDYQNSIQPTRASISLKPQFKVFLILLQYRGYIVFNWNNGWSVVTLVTLTCDFMSLIGVLFVVHPHRPGGLFNNTMSLRPPSTSPSPSPGPHENGKAHTRQSMGPAARGTAQAPASPRPGGMPSARPTSELLGSGAMFQTPEGASFDSNALDETYW